MIDASSIEHGIGASEDKRAVFSELYSGVWRDLYRYAFYYLGNAPDAEDVVQETALRAYKGIGSLKDRAAFKAWMFRILSICCKRKIAETIDIRRSHSGDELLPDIADSAADSNTDLERAIMLQEMLMRLSPDERRLVLLSVVGGYKSEEIASILEMTAGSVRSKLSRTLAKLRGQLGGVLNV